MRGLFYFEVDVLFLWKCPSHTLLYLHPYHEHFHYAVALSNMASLTITIGSKALISPVSPVIWITMAAPTATKTESPTSLTPVRTRPVDPAILVVPIEASILPRDPRSMPTLMESAIVLIAVRIRMELV